MDIVESKGVYRIDKSELTWQELVALRDAIQALIPSRTINLDHVDERYREWARLFLSFGPKTYKRLLAICRERIDELIGHHGTEDDWAEDRWESELKLRVDIYKAGWEVELRLRVDIYKAVLIAAARDQRDTLQK